jgi:hypothetical protein
MLTKRIIVHSSIADPFKVKLQNQAEAVFGTREVVQVITAHQRIATMPS